MAYFYVKSGGTATGDAGRYATQQVGSFATMGAANYYDNINAATGATTAPASGDYICVSDLHAYTSGAADIGITVAAVIAGDYLYLVSVDDSNCDQYKKATAAQETCTSTAYDVRMYGRLSLFGLYLKSSDDIRFGNGYSVLARNTTLEVTGSDDKIVGMVGDGAGFMGVNCAYIGVSGSLLFEPSGGAYVCAIGGSVSGATIMSSGNFFNGGGAVNVSGLDLTSVSDTLIKAVGGSSLSDDTILVSLSGCRLNASVAFTSETFEDPNMKMLVTNSSSSSATAEYQYHYEAHAGAVDDESSIYRDGSTAFPDSAQKISLKVVTDANATYATPLEIEFPSRYAELSSTATDLLRVFILSSAPLTDQDVWVEAVYPDGTTKNLYSFITSGSGDPFASGAALDTNTESWTGRTAENRYQIDLDTSADAGADCVPIIKLYVAKASATIYFCPTIGLS